MYTYIAFLGNEEVRILGLHHVLYDVLGGDYFITADTFWHLQTVFLLSGLIKAVVCYFVCVHASAILPSEICH